MMHCLLELQNSRFITCISWFRNNKGNHCRVIDWAEMLQWNELGTMVSDKNFHI